MMDCGAHRCESHLVAVIGINFFTNQIACRFHCLFCDGYEERGGTSAGIIAEGMLANSTMAVHMGMMAARLAKEITIYSNGDDALASELEGILTSPPLQLEGRPIERLESASEGSGLTVVFEDGSSKREAFVVSEASDSMINSTLMGCCVGPYPKNGVERTIRRAARCHGYRDGIHSSLVAFLRNYGPWGLRGRRLCLHV